LHLGKPHSLNEHGFLASFDTDNHSGDRYNMQVRPWEAVEGNR